MKGINLDVFGDSEADIDLRRCPADQIGILLDLVRFDRFLEYVYVVLLKRDPDREGLAHYRQLARGGVSRRVIVQRLLRSREYRHSSIEAPGLPVDDFVNRVYQDILGRWPDEEGLATYRRIASKRNGRRKVVANLQVSGEAVRKSGGRLARIEALRAYARTGWSTRLPIAGRWFSRQRRIRQRFDQIALNQHLLAQQVANLREEMASLGAAEPFGFISEVQDGGETKGGERGDKIFENALIRARREKRIPG